MSVMEAITENGLYKSEIIKIRLYGLCETVRILKLFINTVII